MSLLKPASMQYGRASVTEVAVAARVNKMARKSQVSQAGAQLLRCILAALQPPHLVMCGLNYAVEGEDQRNSTRHRRFHPSTLATSDLTSTIASSVGNKVQYCHRTTSLPQPV